jgi:hypothetical protein
MLEALGWHNSGSAVDAEDPIVRTINVRINRDELETPTVKEMEDVLSSLPEPWVTKDPKFIHTIDEWIEVFRRHRHKPLLIVVERELSEVKKSFRKKWNWRADVDELAKKACVAYRKWPWQKLLISLEDLQKAACLMQC